MRKKTLLSWSSGKDSAWELHVLRQDPNINVVGLFCTVNRVFDRVAMHGVRGAALTASKKCRASSSANPDFILLDRPLKSRRVSAYKVIYGEYAMHIFN